MSYAVYKYQIEVKTNPIVEMPKYAEILTIQTKEGIPYIWALTDIRAPNVRRHFRIIGTGFSINDPNDLTYIGSFQLCETQEIYHVFE